MGFGDRYHKHPLRLLDSPSSTNCFHCELPIGGYSCYGCQDCNYYIHKLCQDLPIKLINHLHDQHYISRFEPPAGSSFNLLCKECEDPCLGRFAYQCTTCQFFFHLKCLFTLKLEKHQHPLIFDFFFGMICKICGSYTGGFVFGCESYNFYIHYECSLIPLEIKHHHVHKLTLRHNFPEECDQVYCDRCEDRFGEVDRTQSYYYCKDCDYIAHVKCCIAQPREDVLICERFTHKHPLSYLNNLLSCIQCSYTVSKNTSEYPFAVKHPRHPHNTLHFEKKTDKFNCTECNFSMGKDEFVIFNHPLRRDNLQFICENILFRCDACGELGKGSRIGSNDDGRFDLHLECFALSGRLEHESHPDHNLYLRWLNESTSRCCSICRKEMDSQLWFYFCQECAYAAHMDCVARDLLSTLRSAIKNQPDFCDIIAPDASSFKYRIADMRPLLPRLSFYNYTNYLIPRLEVELGDLGMQTDGYELPCPKCNSLIPTQAGYSTIACWRSSFRENCIIIANDQTPSESEPLSLLDEQMIDELCCSICNLSIFPPTYSCASCQIFFHKSCAELPPKIIYNETTYILMAPPFPEGLSNCTHCKNLIYSWAYVSSVEGIIFDVQCASRAPLVNLTHNNQALSSLPLIDSDTCGACRNDYEARTVMLTTNNFDLKLHLECGLLPAVIKHRIHQHPLELATDLAELDCEYICDVCEKDLNPDLWAYRCVDICGKYATSHVSCVITSKKKCHFSYDLECQTWTEEKKLEFWREEKERGKRTIDGTSEHTASESECEEVSDSTSSSQ